MPRPLKKSIKRNGIIKLNKKVRNFKDKAGHVLINSFLLPLLPPHQSYQGIICTNMNNSCIPIFCSSCNGFYDQNILHCRLLGLMINSTSINFFLLLATLLMCSRAWRTNLSPKLYSLLLKDPVSVLPPYLSPV